MDKLPGEQNGGNDCCRAEYRKKKKKEEEEDGLRDLWDNIKLNNIHNIAVPEGKEREKGPKKMFEKVTAENVPNMVKEIVNPSPRNAESQEG